jgi:protease-4
MARKRDIVIAVVIAGSFILAFGFMILVFLGSLEGRGEWEIAGLGGDIGVVELYGNLTEASGREAIDDLEHWAEKSSIKGIVLHINSPGGGVAISQEIYDAVLRAREEKPVVAAMATVAASGAVYVACGADRIVANPGTLTGSIGVIMQFHTAEELLEKIGIGTETVKTGELKDVGSYDHDMTEKEELMLKSVVTDSYEQFVEVVAAGRGMDKAEVYALADGSLFTGLQAYNLGLVDTLGGLHEAVELVADLAGLEGEPEVVRPLKRREMTLFDLLTGAFKGLQEPLGRSFEGPRLMYLWE